MPSPPFGIHRTELSNRHDSISITCLSHTWTGLPRQAADEHFPRKERRFHQARHPVAGHRRKRKRMRGDCQQRVTSGTTLRPPAQSPALGSRCHHTSTNNRTTPSFRLSSRTRFDHGAPEDRIFRSRQNAFLFLGPAPPFLLFLVYTFSLIHIHQWINPLIHQPNLCYFLFRNNENSVHLDFVSAIANVQVHLSISYTLSK